MKRFLLGGSCLVTLFVCGLSAMIGLFLLSVFFQQSQAVTLNNTATRAAQVTLTISHLPTAAPTFNSASMSTDANITIHIETSVPTLEPSAPDAAASSPSPTDFMTSAFTLTPLPTLLPISSGVAPYELGTSSYPLTVTAEVRLGQTSVAHYLSGVDATRTAVAAESVSIYATLTASAAGGP